MVHYYMEQGTKIAFTCQSVKLTDFSETVCTTKKKEEMQDTYMYRIFSTC